MKKTRILLAIILLTASRILWSQDTSPVPSEPSGPLNLASAIALSLSSNPTLSAYSYDVRIVEAKRIRAGFSPNPEIGFESEDFPGSSNPNGADVLQNTLRLSQVIELGGKRALRLDEARLSGDLAAWDYETRRLNVLADTTRRFIEVAAAQERLALAREAAELTKAEQEVVNQRVKAGRSSVVEGQKVQIAVARAKLDEEHAHFALLAARKSLVVMWGNEEASFSYAQAEFFTHLRPDDFGTLLARMGRNPDLARFALEAKLRDSQLRLARASGVPDVTVNLGIRQFAEQKAWSGVAGVSIPLVFFDRGQANVYEALQMKGKTKALDRAIRLELNAILFATYQELLLAVTGLDVMASDILPAAREVLKATGDGYKQGRFSYLEMADARRSLIELRRANIESAFSYHNYLTDIDRLIGTAALAPQSSDSVADKKN